MGCATGIVKIIVFSFNFACSLVGLALIIVGSLIYVSIDKYADVTDNSYKVAPILILTVGCVVFLISFLGCCGVCQKSHCMLISYAVVLLALFVIQLVAGVYGYIQVRDSDGEVRTAIQKTMNDAFIHYNDKDEIRDTFNSMQRELKCCGVKGAADYWNQHPNNYQLPASCCKDYKENEVCNGASNAWDKGCAEKLYDYVVDGVKTVAYVAMGIAAVEIAGALFALCLANSIRNEQRRGGY